MMYLTAETQNGGRFEADSLPQLINNIINHYSERNEDSEDFIRIWGCFFGKFINFPASDLERINLTIQESVRDNINEAVADGAHRPLKRDQDYD